MKSATVQQVPEKWSEILQWIASGEEVEVTQQDQVLARLVPALRVPVAHPDFVSRAKTVWGHQPSGKPLSELVAEGRGNQP